LARWVRKAFSLWIRRWKAACILWQSATETGTNEQHKSAAYGDGKSPTPLTLFIIVLVSLLWEATLAVPYKWWGFQDAQMTGLFIKAWARLPIEEVGVWIAVTYATVIVFEVFKLWQASGKKAKHAFLGKK
jgi:hypothetical protein